jgi:hypothetical protein
MPVTEAELAVIAERVAQQIMTPQMESTITGTISKHQMEIARQEAEARKAQEEREEARSKKLDDIINNQQAVDQVKKKIWKTISKWVAGGGLLSLLGGGAYCKLAPEQVGAADVQMTVETRIEPLEKALVGCTKDGSPCTKEEKASSVQGQTELANKKADWLKKELDSQQVQLADGIDTIIKQNDASSSKAKAVPKPKSLEKGKAKAKAILDKAAKREIDDPFDLLKVDDPFEKE